MKRTKNSRTDFLLIAFSAEAKGSEISRKHLKYIKQERKIITTIHPSFLPIARLSNAVNYLSQAKDPNGSAQDMLYSSFRSRSNTMQREKHMSWGYIDSIVSICTLLHWMLLTIVSSRNNDKKKYRKNRTSCENSNLTRIGN